MACWVEVAEPGVAPMAADRIAKAGPPTAWPPAVTTSENSCADNFRQNEDGGSPYSPEHVSAHHSGNRDDVDDAPRGDRVSSGRADVGPSPIGTSEALLSPVYVLVTSKAFFQPCPTCSLAHSGRDVLLTFFDMRHGTSHCSFCVGNQDPQHVLQVRRSTYYEVVKIEELRPYVDLSGIQEYIINSSKVVFLRPRPQPKAAKGVALPARCLQDGRQLMDDQSHFCSVRCKLETVDPLFASVAPKPAEKYVSRRKNKKVRDEAVAAAAAADHHEAAAASSQAHDAKKARTEKPGTKVENGAYCDDVNLPSWGLRVHRYSNTQTTPAKSGNDAVSHMQLDQFTSRKSPAVKKHAPVKGSPPVSGVAVSHLTSSIASGDSARSNSSKKRKGHPMRSPSN